MGPLIEGVARHEGRAENSILFRLLRCCVIILPLAIVVCVLWPTIAAADGPLGETVTPGSNLPKAHVEAKVESRPDGVYIQISVRQSVPGSDQSAQQMANTQAPTTSGSTSAGSGGRWWRDVTGIHWDAPDGSTYFFTPPNIGSATQNFWHTEFAAHPDQMPYTFFADNQYQGIIWIPNNSNSNNIVFGPPPPAPGGNGSSTDPHEVALDALGHVPLPAIQIRMNPALGLVAMPGWFWVEGYDGQPFGTSRTVDIPPEIGPEVPFNIVPADDPRRQGTSFTVDVRVWPSRYEWSFGDGEGLVTQSLGQKYPSESDIQHTYEHSSLQFPVGFPVQLTVVFAAEFSINGGAPQGLPPISQTYADGYRVQEIQPVLTNP